MPQCKGRKERAALDEEGQDRGADFFADIVGHESSDDEKYMMRLKDVADSNAPDVESNSKPEEETKDKTPRHPETTIAIPVALGSKKMKTVRCLLDMCTAGLLMDTNFFKEFLRDYRNTEAFTERNKSQWATGNIVFMSKGKETISNMCLPSFMMKCRFSASFDFLPEVREHTYHIILGVAGFCQLEMYFDLEKDLVKWLGISLPMVKCRFWQQNKINAFWSKVGKQTVNVGQQKK
eukprot:1355203-Ditylum_brightwellii.AAC.1